MRRWGASTKKRITQLEDTVSYLKSLAYEASKNDKVFVTASHPILSPGDVVASSQKHLTLKEAVEMIIKYLDIQYQEGQPAEARLVKKRK